MQFSKSLRNIGLLVFFGITACSPTPEIIPPTPTATLGPTATASLTPSNTPTATPEPVEDISFLNQPDGTLRVISYNINWDSIFPVGDPDSHDLRTYAKEHGFFRIMQATSPDIVCLQEINPSRDASEIAEIMNEALGETTWQAVGVRDSFIASRYPLSIGSYELDPNTYHPSVPQASTLVDLPDSDFVKDIFVTCSHFKASGTSGDRLLRRRQADMIMFNIHDFISPGGNFDGAVGTPFLILGDFNIYNSEGIPVHLTTLLSGDISNEDQFGVDFEPDWDRTALGDALPSHNGLGEEFYTWRDDQSVFGNEILDRVIYSDSVLSISNSFILDTSTFSQSALDAAGLQSQDVALIPANGYFDHYPLVVDFTLDSYQ
jgi:endonuclease/exonuclease/phosphatase family metal-dependent hydrolase